MDTIKVLLADDHMLFREGIEVLLNREQDIQCVAVAKDGEETIKLAKELQPDVVLMDIAMPNVNGIQAAKQIKISCPNTGILILSAYKCMSYLIGSIRAQVDGYVLKNTPRFQLVNAIRVIAAGGRVFDSAINDVLSLVASGSSNKETGYPGLRQREIQVLELVARGLTNKEIGRELSISSRTVDTYFAAIFGKLGVQSRTQAALYAVQQHLINIDDVNEGPVTDSYGAEH